QKQNDNLLKIVALVCAVLLWFYADAQENPLKERQLTIPVRYVNLVSGYVVENAGQSVQITVKGNETDIMSLRSDDFTATVDSILMPEQSPLNIKLRHQYMHGATNTHHSPQKTEISCTRLSSRRIIPGRRLML
ncbi:MAG: hypothetical protein IIV59_06680, partial [Selenomonadaceae bacterium]|nr:hypothetical protein [Selenomonadaceae bacterium]